jgi:hypothetical protein
MRYAWYWLTNWVRTTILRQPQQPAPAAPKQLPYHFQPDDRVIPIIRHPLLADGDNDLTVCMNIANIHTHDNHQHFLTITTERSSG